MNIQRKVPAPLLTIPAILLVLVIVVWANPRLIFYAVGMMLLLIAYGAGMLVYQAKRAESRGVRPGSRDAAKARTAKAIAEVRKERAAEAAPKNVAVDEPPTEAEAAADETSVTDEASPSPPKRVKKKTAKKKTAKKATKKTSTPKKKTTGASKKSP